MLYLHTRRPPVAYFSARTTWLSNFPLKKPFLGKKWKFDRDCWDGKEDFWMCLMGRKFDFGHGGGRKGGGRGGRMDSWVSWWRAYSKQSSPTLLLLFKINPAVLSLNHRPNIHGNFCCLCYYILFIIKRMILENTFPFLSFPFSFPFLFLIKLWLSDFEWKEYTALRRIFQAVWIFNGRTRLTLFDGRIVWNFKWRNLQVQIVMIKTFVAEL